MRFRGTPIFHIAVPRSGITYEPELEQRLSAQWGNYKWEEFLNLDGERQSEIVATYRASNQIEAVLADAAKKKGSGKRKG